MQVLAGVVALLYVAIGVNIGWMLMLLLQRSGWRALLLPGGVFLALLLILRLGLDTPSLLERLTARAL